MKTSTHTMNGNGARDFTESIAQNAMTAAEQLTQTAQKTMDKSQKLAEAGIDILQDSAMLAANRAKEYSLEGLEYIRAKPTKSLLVLAGVGAAIYLIYAMSTTQKHTGRHYTKS